MMREIKDFPNYLVTDKGEILSKNYHREGRIAKLQPRIKENGYPYVILRKDGLNYTKTIHRIVAESFIPNPDNKQTVNHKNGNKTDNRVENLEWATQSENIKHAYRVLKRQINKNWLGKFGKNNPKSKIVIQLFNKNIIAEFNGLHEAERQTHINRVSIKLVCQGKRNSAGGYQWRYKNIS
jgi:hypothetical protein